MFTRCSRSDDLNYRDYVEGPYIISNGDIHELLYVKLVDNQWVNERKQLESLQTIEVDNPLLPAFQVNIQNELAVNPGVYPVAKNMIMMSDIEGNFSAFVRLLLGQNVIDENGNWIFGDGQLVILGDLFDRGPDVTPLLWLLYKLEQEARLQNGYVHILIGNHESMIFQGDITYVNAKYKKQAADLGISYDSLFAVNTVLGKWLRSKPAIIKIGNLLLSHAGVSPEVREMELSIEQMNKTILDTHMERWEMSNDPASNLLLGGLGILWYRNWVMNVMMEEDLDPILEFYDVDQMIVGHTIVENIQYFYNNKLIAIDLQQPKSINGKKVFALGYFDGAFHVIDSDGKRKLLTE